MSEEKEIIQLLTLQRSAIRMLEKLLADYKELYASERDQASQLRDILERIECPEFEPAKNKSEKELIKNYGII